MGRRVGLCGCRCRCLCFCVSVCLCVCVSVCLCLCLCLFENKCLQEAVVAMCTGSFQFRAHAFFSARCANSEKSWLSGSAAEARNFFAVREFLAMCSCCVYVVDRSQTRFWTLESSVGSVLGTLLWDEVLGHAHMVCLSDVSRRLGDSSDALWLRCAVGGPKKNKNCKRGASLTRAARAERAGAVLAKRLTSDALVSSVSDEEVSVPPHMRFFDEPEGVLDQQRSDIDQGALRYTFDDGDGKPCLQDYIVCKLQSSWSFALREVVAKRLLACLHACIFAAQPCW